MDTQERNRKKAEFLTKVYGKKWIVSGAGLEERAEGNASGYGEVRVRAHTPEAALKRAAELHPDGYGLWINPERQGYV